MQLCISLRQKKNNFVAFDSSFADENGSLSEHQTSSFPRRTAATDGLSVGNHVEGHCQFPEYGHHVPIKLCAALDVRRPPRLLHQVADLLPVPTLTEIRRRRRVRVRVPVGECAVEAD